jgi:hypothetical protein
MTKYTRKNLEHSLLALNKEYKLPCTPEDVQAMSMINLVYRIQFLLIKFECEPFTQGEIDSLIYY